jgi:hypothetical protein
LQANKSFPASTAARTRHKPVFAEENAPKSTKVSHLLLWVGVHVAQKHGCGHGGNRVGSPTPLPVPTCSDLEEEGTITPENNKTVGKSTHGGGGSRPAS